MSKISNSPSNEPSGRNGMPAMPEAACLRVKKGVWKTVEKILAPLKSPLKNPASPDREGGTAEREKSVPDATERKKPSDATHANLPPAHRALPRDPLKRKGLDFVKYGPSGFYFGFAATALAIETITENGYLLSHFLLRQFPGWIDLGSGQSMATVFMLKNAAVFLLCSGITGTFTKFALENGVRKNPYIRPIGSSLRLQATPFSDSGEIHFHAWKPFYEEAARSEDPDRFIALKFVRDFKKGLETFATGGFLKRTDGIETLSQIILHSPLITEERMESIRRMVSKYPNLEFLADTRRLPIWKERAAELTSKNVPIFETWPELLPKSRDFVFKGSRGFGWIGPKWRAVLVTTAGVFQGISRLPAEAVGKLVGRGDSKSPPYYHVTVRRLTATEGFARKQIA